MAKIDVWGLLGEIGKAIAQGKRNRPGAPPGGSGYFEEGDVPGAPEFDPSSWGIQNPYNSPYQAGPVATGIDPYGGQDPLGMLSPEGQFFVGGGAMTVPGGGGMPSRPPQMALGQEEQAGYGRDQDEVGPNPFAPPREDSSLTGWEKAAIIASALGAAGNIYGAYQEGRSRDEELEFRRELDRQRQEWIAEDRRRRDNASRVLAPYLKDYLESAP